MCGILGFFSPKYDVKRFQQALKLLNHRGPYGQGFVCFANGALGMARLPMSGNLPVAVPPQVSGYTAAFNGEVYSPGHQLKDEVSSLISGLQRSKVPDGMYAISYWDEINKELVLYRDQFGIKPLYYVYHPEQALLAFASELEPLLKLLDNVRIDLETVAQIVATGVSLDFSTLFEGIKILNPGTKLTFSYTDRGFRLRRKETIKNLLVSESTRTEDLIGQSIDACKDTFRQTALLVSGGVDSNLISSYLDPGFERFNLSIEGCNDCPVSDSTVRKICFGESEFMVTLRKAVCNFGSASRMTSLLMYQKLSDGVADAGYHSVIVGEGADEMFWGYSRHIELWNSRHNISATKFAGFWFGDYENNSSCLSNMRRAVLCDQVADLASDALNEGFNTAVERFDLNYSLEPLLRRSDHLLMSRTIEARTPFLHGGLPYSLPTDRRVWNGVGKAKLYEILSKRTPAWRPREKQHFRAPIEEWTTALKEMRCELKRSLSFLQNSGLEGLNNTMIDELQAPQLFTLTTLSIWGQEYGKYL